MALNTITLKWNLTDLLQGGQTATLIITPTAQMADATDHVLVAQPVPRRYTFSGGQGQLAGIIANDNANILPAGTGYTIEIISGSGQVIIPAFTTQLLFANGATQWLDQLAPVASVTTAYQYLPLPSGTPAPGTVPVATGAGAASVWGTGLAGAGLTFASPSAAVGETCPRPITTGTSSASLVSGTVYMRAIGLVAGTTVRNLTLVTAAGNVATQANITHGWYALCDSSRTVVAVSSDQTAAAVWTAQNTSYTLPILGAGGAAYAATYSGLYYVAEMVAVSAGNMPQFAVSGSVAAGVGAIAPVPYGTSSIGQGAPPAIGAQLAAVTFSNSNAFYGYAS